MEKHVLINILKQHGCSPDIIKHCGSVANFAKNIADRISLCDSETVYTGGMLHDIGRCRTHSIRHGYEGAKIAEEIGLPGPIVGIIRNHIGAGLTASEAIALGLPEEDFIPKTIEAKVVAHADNLIEETQRRRFDDLISRLEKEGKNSLAEKIAELHHEISGLAGIDVDTLEIQKIDD